jgi:hypothetical protein
MKTFCTFDERAYYHSGLVKGNLSVFSPKNPAASLQEVPISEQPIDLHQEQASHKTQIVRNPKDLILFCFLFFGFFFDTVT